MPQRIIALALSALCCAGSLSACGERSVKDAQPPSIENQLSLILSEKDVWGSAEEECFDAISYLVSDLDHNGRLEIISAGISGTGLYTTARFYEVDESGSALIPCSYSVPEYDSGADLSFSSTVPCFYDAANGAFYYIFTDQIRIGAAETCDSLIAIGLQNGTVTPRYLGRRETIYSDYDRKESVAYLRADGTEIDEAAFNALADDTFAGMEKNQAVLTWFTPQSSDGSLLSGAAEMDDDTLLADLQASWTVFSWNADPAA